MQPTRLSYRMFTDPLPLLQIGVPSVYMYILNHHPTCTHSSTSDKGSLEHETRHQRRPSSEPGSTPLAPSLLGRAKKFLEAAADCMCTLLLRGS